MSRTEAIVETLQFKDWILEEGDRWNAVKHAFQAGFQAYQKKRDHQKKNAEKERVEKTFARLGKRSEQEAVDFLVSHGYTLSSNGEVTKRRTQPVSELQKWLLESKRTAST